jgi:hypothetical protein
MDNNEFEYGKLFLNDPIFPDKKFQVNLSCIEDKQIYIHLNYFYSKFCYGYSLFVD